MKKLSLFLGMALAASLSLTNCTEKIEGPIAPATPAGIPFEISADISTKTTNDGLATKWAEGDAINLFHAEASTAGYVSDKDFTLDATRVGVFTGNLSSALDPSKSYDWYAFYPYSEYNKTPAGVSKETFGYTHIGDKSQTQEGNDSKAHLCGDVLPLYGVVKSLASDVKPAVTMNNLASVVAVKVKNTTTEPLVVKSVSFTSTEDIVGTYYIDFTGENVVYTGSGDKYVSATASLTVNNGGAIAENAEATFYIPIKPHTVKTGSTLKISVNGYEKPLTLPKDVTFTAGKIKTLAFKYDKEAETLERFVAIDKVESLKSGAKVLLVAKSGEKYYNLPVNPNIEKGKISGEDISISGNSVEYMPSNAWSMVKDGDHWQICYGSSRLYHANGGASGTDLNFGNLSQFPWQITAVASKTFKFAGVNNNEVKTRGLLYSTSVGMFGGYSLSNINNGYVPIMIFVRESDLSGSAPQPQLLMPEVKCVTQTENSLTFSWTVVENATKYQVSTDNVKWEDCLGTEYTMTGLSAGMAYILYVKAIGDGTTYLDSDVASAKGTTKATSGAVTEPIVFGKDWNTLFGTSYNGVFNPKANELSLNGSVNGVSIKVTNGKSTNGLIREGDFRAYNGYTITFTAPQGSTIKSIVSTKGGKTFTTGVKADSGNMSITNNAISWIGDKQTVKLTISGTVSFATITITL